MKICFIGLSHLGLNYLAASAAKGFKVIGYDPDINLIKKLKLNKKIFKEPFLFENIKKYKNNIFFTNNVNDIIKSKIIFISTDIDTDKDGKSNLNKINKYINLLKLKFKNQNLVIMSQVKPGFTNNINWNKENLFYQVETLIFGNSFKRALNPERIILGVKNIDKKVNKDLENFYSKFKCPIIKTDYNTAEITKISINLYLISSITTTNLLSRIVKKINANWIDIEKALKLDKRIGKYAYLKPGLGISGGNLERDLYNIIKIADENKIPSDIFKLWKENSVKQKSWVKSIKKQILKSKKNLNIGILGLAYKANTSSIKNSPSIELINSIKSEKIFVYDPVVKKINLKKNLFVSNNIYQVLNVSNILFIMTPWNIFKKININQIYKSKIKIIVDPYALLVKYKNLFYKKKIEYHSLI
tara:strand:+ start:7840 stop:9087 length:1248 start_codon:yes stop_codon:yes gene_type:complete